MTNMFISLPLTVADAALPVIPAADIDYLVTEPSAHARWDFGTGAESALVDTLRGLVATPAGVGVAFSSGYMTLDLSQDGAGLVALSNVGLSLGIPETAAPDDTVTAIIEASGAGTQILFGTLGAATGGGLYVVTASAEHRANSRGLTPSNFSLGATYAASHYYFVSRSRAYSGASKVVRTNIHGVASEVTMTGTYLPSSGALALGPMFYPGAGGLRLRVAELTYYDYAMTAEQLAAARTRALARAAARGIIAT